MTVNFDDAARFYAARDLERAARVCLDVLREDPRHYNALHLLGVICTNRGQHSDGVSYLLRAASVHANDASLFANLGSAYGAVQRFDKALEAYQRAMVMGRRNSGVLNNLGLAYRGLGRSKTPIATFRDGFGTRSRP